MSSLHRDSQVGIKLRDPAALAFASKQELDAEQAAAERLRLALVEIDALGALGARAPDTEAVASVDRRVKACRAVLLSKATAPKEKAKPSRDALAAQAPLSGVKRDISLSGLEEGI